MKELRNKHRQSNSSKGELERQIGYLVRAVEDISNRLDVDSLSERDSTNRLSDFRDKMTEETCSLKTQVSILTSKINSLEANLKKFIVITSSIVAGVATAVGSLDPSSVPSLILFFKQFFI